MAELEAAQLLGRFRDEARSAQLLLNARSDERRQLEEGLAHCRRALDLYGVLDGPDWQARPAVRRLPVGDQAGLREELSELLLLLARGTSLNGPATQGPAGAGGPLQLALDLNRRAEALARDGKPSRALLSQRAELTRLLGRPDEARALREKADQTPLLTARDRYLAAAEHSARGRYREALPLLQLAVDKYPQSFWSWFLLGHCHAKLTRYADAAASYNAAVALWPQYPWVYFNRGLVYLWQSNHRRAAADFDHAIRLRPELTEPYLNRAIARQGLGDYAGAIDDLTLVLGREPDCTRAYFMRARARELAGDEAGARRDRDEGMRHEPADEHGWLARGIARMAADPPGALADFEKALEFNPRSLVALQNRAHLLGRTGRTEEAAATLDRAVAFYPDYVPARAGRGVYRARLRQWTAALEDAREALLRDTSAANAYQVAGIYALTSRENADDRPEAFRLLTTALRGGFGFDLLEADRDLDPIRQEPEFQRLVRAARAVRTTGPGK
jgi:tetratricopeptide (TPR) repeat protein